jgi:hypothetical protein
VVEAPLRGWKDIAAFLATSPRSAQRWERELGLPIHRLRTTTGSVVNAYPSELDAWRRSRSAELDAQQVIGAGAGDPTDELDAPEGISAAFDQYAMPTRAPAGGQRLVGRPRRWIASMLVVGLGLGSGWVWHRYQAARESGGTVGATAGNLLRVTSGGTTLRLQPGADGFAALTLPGLPALQVRAVRSGSELTLELHRNRASQGAPPRVALLRLTPEIPAEMRLAGGKSVSFVWEDTRQSAR